MIEKDFIPLDYIVEQEEKIKKGEITYKSPSNIALVKYWGKKENQIPINASISFTLDASATTTTVHYKRINKKSTDFSFDLLFEGKTKEDFIPKIKLFFSRVYIYLPFLKVYHFTIETSNTFPHSSGIASSASSMSALSLCLMHIEKQLNPEMSMDFFIKKASFLARLGSGSACRSIEGDIVQWGDHIDIKGSSNLFGIKYPYRVHEVFKNYQDTILLVDKGKKQVSSTVGHDLMHNNVYAKNRFVQAQENLSQLQGVFANGDLKKFIEIVESEALTLHAMMMTSLPYFILMKPNTLKIINKIWAYRKISGSNVCFTLDAGANVHVLYPKSEKKQVKQFIKNELVAYCENGQYICDSIGCGAKRLIIND